MSIYERVAHLDRLSTLETQFDEMRLNDDLAKAILYYGTATVIADERRKIIVALRESILYGPDRDEKDWLERQIKMSNDQVYHLAANVDRLTAREQAQLVAHVQLLREFATLR